jgi:hypothetical protein
LSTAPWLPVDYRTVAGILFFVSDRLHAPETRMREIANTHTRMKRLVHTFMGEIDDDVFELGSTPLNISSERSHPRRGKLR